MLASIITVGTEILVGSILNTHAEYISNKLNDLGVHVNYHISVRDNLEEMEDVIKEQLKKVDIIFLCGGLGPTADDVTKEALANVIDRKIILDEYQHQKLLSRFEQSNRKMTENNLRQAMVIQDATLLDNKWGVAPGECIEYKNKKIFLLPGPPKELRPMVDEYLTDYIIDENEVVIRSLNVAGLGESVVEDRIRKLNLETENISINTFAKFYDTEVKIIAEGHDRNSLIEQVDYIANKLYEAFGSKVYSEGNISLNQTLVDLLKEKNLKISFSESITGGLLASQITSISGASNVLSESYITYSNETKSKILGVKPETLESFGAVSRETVYEMAKGLKQISNADVCVSTTGEAGPNPSEKEVGLCYICYYFGEDNYKIVENKFRGSRNDIQKRVCDTAILDLILMLRG
ncbi:competence/damage-inducible protein A [Peptoniphilus asaccharolyticus]